MALSRVRAGGEAIEYANEPSYVLNGRFPFFLQGVYFWRPLFISVQSSGPVGRNRSVTKRYEIIFGISVSLVEFR